MQPLANITPIKPAARAGAVQVDGVGLIYKTSGQDVVAVSDVSIEVRPGRFVVLVGPSGCGKSSLLMMMGCEAIEPAVVEEVETPSEVTVG